MGINMDSILNGATEMKGGAKIPPEVIAQQLKNQGDLKEGETISLLGEDQTQRIREEGMKDPRYLEGKKNLESFKEKGVKISYTDETPAERNLKRLEDEKDVHAEEMKGLIVENKKPVERPHHGQLSPDIEEKIDNVKSELDEGIAKAKKNLEDLLGRPLADGEVPSQEELAAAKRRKAGLEEESWDEPSDEEIRAEEEAMAEENEKKYKEAVVIIDKSGMGHVDFTEEERAKLEEVKVIKLQEVEKREIPVFKTKKVKSKSVKQILAKTIAPYTTKIVAVNSGFTATMSACSAYELIELLTAEELYDTASSGLEAKWQIIYNHIVETSIGKMSFDTFLHNVSSLDFEMFIYGILASTYGAKEQTMEITCFRQCGPFDKQGKPTNFTHDYSFYVKELIRPERFSEKLSELFKGVVDNATTKEDSNRYRDENAPVLVTKNIFDETTGMWFQLQIPSVHSVITKIYPTLERYDKNKDKIKAQLGIMASNIRRVLVPDLEANDGSFYELTEMNEIIECLYSLPKTSLEIVSSKIEELADGLSMEFGFMNVRCTNCNHVTPFVPVNLSDMLFILAEQEKNVTIER